MSFIEYGAQSTDTPKTPTLRQWCKANVESEIQVSRVKVVFKPGKYASFTFVTEADFKVVVERQTPLEAYLLHSLGEALDEGACLYIQIKNKDKGSWALSALESSQSEWEEFPWGWKAGEVKSSPPDPKNSTRQSSKSGLEKNK